MPYLGNIPAENYASFDKQTITGDGGTSYTLDHPVGSAQEVAIFVNNVRQEPGVAYTVTGTALTMTGNVESTDDFYAIFIGKAVQTVEIPEKATNGDYDFDNGTLFVDASSNVVRVGKSSGGVTTDGWQLSAAGSHYAIPSGHYFILNRTTSGAATMLDFRSENTSKGAITYNGTNISYTSGSNNIFNQSGVSFDNGSNYLDDYEEGTFTPTFVRSGTAPSYTASSAEGHYTKIGNTVFIQIRIIVTAVATSGTGNLKIAGIPFSGGVAPVYANAMNVGYNDTFDAAIKDCYVVGSQLQLIPTGITQSNYGGVLSTGYCGISGTYHTAS